MIKLIKNYKYDNNYEYVKMFTTKSEQIDYFNSLDNITFDDESYIKINNSFNVEYNYDYLLLEGVNYVLFNNGKKDIFAFITSKEYVNDRVTKILFEVDVMQTFLFDFSINKSFVERKKCTIDEIIDFDEGIEVGEHVAKSNTIVYTKEGKYMAVFKGIKSKLPVKDEKGMITNIIDYEGGLERPMLKMDNINYPISLIPLDEDLNNTFEKYLNDHPSLVSIIRFPNCNFEFGKSISIPVMQYREGELEQGFAVTRVVTNATSNNVDGGGFSVPKNNITDFYPYTFYVLTDGETEPLIMKPQFLPSSCTIKCKFALSLTPVERYYPSSYKGDTTGNVYNITNTNIMSLPSANNEGMTYLTNNSNMLARQEKNAKQNYWTGMGGAALGMAQSMATGNIFGAVSSGISGAIGISNTLNDVKNTIASNKDMIETPNSITSFGTPSTRKSFGTDNVRVIKYQIKDEYIQRLNNYVERFGNKFNNYATIDLKSYKGYIKFIGVDLDTKLDNSYTQKIISILEGGVFIE